MFKEPELKPGQKLTPIQHPNQSLAPVVARLRAILLLVVVLAAGGVLYLLKQDGEKQRTAAVQAKAAAEADRAQKNTQLAKKIPIANKGESKNAAQRALVLKVGSAIAQKSDAKNAVMKWNFHLLAEENAINLYALTSGDVYVTTALVNRMKTEGALAAALAHGIAHAMTLTTPEPLPNASDDHLQWNYAIETETPADMLALTLMAQAGYDPTAMIALFSILADGYNKGADVGFFVTHPNDRDRMSRIDTAIKQMYPQGIPAVLSK